MPGRTPPIARIRLARSVPRILLLPILLVAAGLALPVAAELGPLRLPPAVVGAAAVVGAGIALVGVLVAVRPLTARLEVEESAVRVRWLGGERVYGLTPGPVTRVRFRGEGASSLRSRSGGLGWSLGRARLRGEEDIEIVRLAPELTAILVPTERGRLAICARSEDELLDALSRAARARRRLEELASAGVPSERPDVPSPTPAAPAAPERGAGQPAIDVDETGPAEPEPHVLTGIERAELEERLARERAAAAAIEAEAAAGAIMEPPAPALPAAAAPAAEPARRRFGGRRLPGVARPGPSAALVGLPLLGAGIVWGAAAVAGRLPDPASDIGRLTALALVLAGPATSVGAIMARAWWPRLAAVVVAGGLAASVFVGRALLGGLN